MLVFLKGKPRRDVFLWEELLWPYPSGGWSPSFEHLLVPFPKEGESEAWAGDSGKKLGKGDR